MTLGKNKVINHFEIEKEVIKKNRIAGHSKSKEEMKNANRNIFKISFFNWKMIKYN